MDISPSLCIVKHDDMKWQIKVSVLVFAMTSCEILDDDIGRHVGDRPFVELSEVASILASVPMAPEHVREVYDAVSSSSGNGYDEEYTMRQLFECPGSGVGEEGTKAYREYGSPLRGLIEDYIRSGLHTKASSSSGAGEVFLEALMDSDIQIYWPYSEAWDGKSMPIITFDPEDGTEMNEGYRLTRTDGGSLEVETVMVDEKMALTEPVWVVNRNTDAGHMSLEMLRKTQPGWGEGGGSIVVRPSSAVKSPSRTLVLKDFTMHRNFDTWFAGASEFFVKMGSVEDFTASTEAELRLYNPVITDFMVVVRRSQVGVPQPFNAVLVSDWSEQLTHSALMITEDDGGTRTSWKCSAVVRIKSKSYGFDIDLPMNSRDDIVWRGQVSSRWIEDNDDVSGRFGDVSLTFGIVM